jgi:hypothetical protein
MGLPIFTNRYEIKYILDLSQYSHANKLFKNLLIPDKNRNYYNQSVYFDSTRYGFYSEKREGFLERTKPRLRIYRRYINDEPIALFIELKYRKDMITRKERRKVDQQFAKNLLYGNFESNIIKINTCRVLSKFYYYYRKFGLRPSINIVYHREAYHSQIYPQLRMTFDSKLQSSLNINNLNVPGSSPLFALKPNCRILEIKYNGMLPRVILNYIKDIGAQRWSLSKYAMCLENNYENIRNPFRQII